MSDTVLASREGPVALVTLCRPDRFNAFDLATIQALEKTVEAALADEGVRALVLTGEGRAFCAGGDVAEMAAKGDAASGHFLDLTAAHHPLVELLVSGRKPVVTAVNGVAAGGGVGLALAGDYRVGGASARFRSAYFKLGVSPDGGATFLLPRLVGMAAAQRFLYRDETVGAEEARALGLLHEVVPDAELRARALQVATELAGLPLGAFARTKALLASSVGGAGSLRDQLDAERHLIAESATTAEFREGARAFSEKRAPRFVAGQ